MEVETKNNPNKEVVSITPTMEKTYELIALLKGMRTDCAKQALKNALEHLDSISTVTSVRC